MMKKSRSRRRRRRNIMKRIFIFSDTHGSVNGCEAVLRGSEEKADGIIHAGDYTRDADSIRAAFPGLPVYAVKGNGDLFSTEPQDLTVVIDGVKIFITHGHMYNVKLEYDYSTLREKGKELGADLIVFGHTHKPYLDWDGDMTVVNPGSAGYGGTYAVAKIENGNVRVDMYDI